MILFFFYCQTCLVLSSSRNFYDRAICGGWKHLQTPLGNNLRICSCSLIPTTFSGVVQNASYRTYNLISSHQLLLKAKAKLLCSLKQSEHKLFQLGFKIGSPIPQSLLLSFRSFDVQFKINYQDFSKYPL